MSPGAGPDARLTTPVRLAGAAVVALAGIVTYWPALDAGFVGDDFMILDRLDQVAAPSDALRFFRGEFFGYYRPLGFLSHAADWMLAGADPRQFHLTNVFLHVLNGLLLFGLAYSLAAQTIENGVRVTSGPIRPAIAAAVIAALLFVLHASNHEAVVWVSARFDLLATAWTLAALWWMVSDAPGSRWGPAILFLPALLSKESTVAVPLAAAAWAVFCRGAGVRDAVIRVAPWMAVLLVYAVVRQIAGGVPATGGAARAPKLLAFAGLLVLLIAGGGGRWIRVREWLQARGGLLAVAAAVLAAGAALIWWMPAGAPVAFLREKLTVAGFAIYYLVTPFTDAGTGGGDLRPIERTYAAAAVVGVPSLALAAWLLRRPLLSASAAWFLAALLLATWLPISALTEGRRYLYLPSAVVALAAGLCIAALGRHARAVASVALIVFLGLSWARITAKLDDWIWAGRMTAEGARLADAALAPACGRGHVVFLTSPVAVRGVYSHFYHETFALSRGCTPEIFQIVARVMRVDTRVEARWKDRRTIVLTVPGYRGNLVLSEDLRHFDVPLDEVRERTFMTPLGEVRTEPAGADQRLSLSLSHPVPESIRFFYFSEGRVLRLAAPPGRAAFDVVDPPPAPRPDEPGGDDFDSGT